MPIVSAGGTEDNRSVVCYAMCIVLDVNTTCPHVLDPDPVTALQFGGIGMGCSPVRKDLVWAEVGILLSAGLVEWYGLLSAGLGEWYPSVGSLGTPPVATHRVGSGGRTLFGRQTSEQYHNAGHRERKPISDKAYWES